MSAASVSASANVTGGNIISDANIAGNIIIANNQFTTTGNVNGGKLVDAYYTGNITIHGGDVTSLLPLLGLTTITGNLVIEETELDKDTMLDGLDDVVTITGTITLKDNPDLPLCEVQEFAIDLTPPRTVIDQGGNDTTTVCT